MDDLQRLGCAARKGVTAAVAESLTSGRLSADDVVRQAVRDALTPLADRACDPAGAGSGG